ncbi:MAG: 5'-methylthioadenosine/adenosylhomocysteine nucleosidase [Clostridiales bacterium]|nr:5'-methylthioadenosine/adenosylhomocysteine nucleosidase [Clostridiales bacterium]
MKKIGIIGAMELEVETLKEKMNVNNIVKKASMDFYEGCLNGVDVIIVRSGIGKVNAGICVQILVDLFQVTHIINTGVAGSLNAKIDIGDIVISTDALYHDVDATIFGYQPGEIPQMGRREFTADESLAALAQASCREVNPDIHVFSGRIVSGDQFVSDKSVKDRLVNVFEGFCTEMEGTAIAQASTLNNIPFVIIRAISDKADESAEVDYPTFERKAAADCAKLVARMIQKI